MRQTRTNNPFKPTTITMKATSSASKAQITSLLTAGYSVRQIASQTHYSISTISRIESEHCPEATRGSGGCPSKLTPTNICHATHLLGSNKAENAVQITRKLRDITHTSLSGSQKMPQKGLFEGCGEGGEASPPSQAQEEQDGPCN